LTKQELKPEGLEIRNLDTGCVETIYPNAEGAMVIPAGRWTPTQIYQIPPELAGLEWQILDIPPRTGNANKEA
jgi:hypothetical protein